MNRERSRMVCCWHMSSLTRTIQLVPKKWTLLLTKRHPLMAKALIANHGRNQQSSSQGQNDRGNGQDEPGAMSDLFVAQMPDQKSTKTAFSGANTENPHLQKPGIILVIRTNFRWLKSAALLQASRLAS